MFNLFNKDVVKSYKRILDDSGTGDPGTGDSSGDGNKNKPGDDNRLTVVATKDPRTGRVTYKATDGTALFSQEHMNYEIGEARKKESEKNKTLVTQLEEMRDHANTSESLRQELQMQIEELQKAGLTEKQQMDLELKQWKTRHENDTNTLKQEVESWRKQFSDSFVRQEIRKAANTNKVLPLAVDQLDDIIGTQAEVKLMRDQEGKEVPGMFEAVVSIRDEDAEGKSIITTMPIDKAVARMRELPHRYGNLFESDQKGGVGGGTMMNSGSSLAGTVPDFSKMTVVEYQKWRAANLDKVGEA